MSVRRAAFLSVGVAIAMLASPTAAQHGPVRPDQPAGGGHGSAQGHGSRQGHGHPQVAHVRRPSPKPDRIRAPKNGSTFQMSDWGGRPVVSVHVNGRGPYRFVLDTGATISVIAPALADELGLPPAEGVRDTTGHMGKLVHARELRVGDVALHGVTLSASEGVIGVIGPAGLRGVLSAYSFPGYLLSIDYPSRQITVQKGKLEKPDAQTIFEYRSEDMFPMVPLSVAGNEVRATVDSGSGYALLMPTKYMQELPLASQPVVAGEARYHAGTAPISRAALNGKVVLGKYDLQVEEVLFTDIRVGPPKANIGFEVLRKFVVTLDSKNRRIRFAQ